MKILLIEDDRATAQLIKLQLMRFYPEAEIKILTHYRQLFTMAIKVKDYALVILDFIFSSGNSARTFKLFSNAHVPVVLHSSMNYNDIQKILDLRCCVIPSNITYCNKIDDLMSPVKDCLS